MNIILPCAGKSTRYPNEKPKYLLTLPNGQIMFDWAIDKLPKYDIYMTILKEHEDKYKVSEVVKKVRPDIKLTILDKSDSQVETIRETIKQNKLKGEIFCKDCDNQFKLDNINIGYDYIAVIDLEKTKVRNIQNKGYIDTLYQKMVNKRITSNYITCGGYYFKDAKEFIKLSKMASNISDVVNRLEYFEIREATDYIDLGTLDDFIAYRMRFKNFIVDIDGVLVENGSEFFEPNWKNTKQIKENVSFINKLHDDGNYIILMTARKEKYRKETENVLKGVKYHKLIMGVLHGSRVVINDYDKYYPTAEAVNIKRNNII